MKSDKNDPLLAEKIRSLALQQIDLAREQLTNSNWQVDEAIHETRRSLKRLRAILRLVKNEVGAPIYDRDNSYFRNLGRQLSELRDATVIRQTLGGLQKQFPQTLAADTWRIIKKDLVGSRRIQPHKKLMAAVATKLKIARARVENWPPGI